MTIITDNMDAFAIDLYGKMITKAEFDDCTFVSCKFTEFHFENYIVLV